MANLEATMTDQQAPTAAPAAAPEAAPVSDRVACAGGSHLEGSIRWWHGAFVFVLALTSAIIVLADLESERKAISLGLLAVIGLAYALVGRNQILVTTPNAPMSVGYLTVLGLAGVTVTAVAPDGGYLILFIIFPHVWALLTRKWAVLGSVLVVTSMVTLAIWRATEGNVTGGAVLAGVVSGMFTLGLALLLGLWLSWLIEDNERKRGLIAELQGTRAELAAAHHREGVLAERQRVAAEIHDTLAQGFMSILVLSQAPPTHDQLSRIERTARENLAEARSLIEALGPDELRAGSLSDACRRVVERLDDERPDLRAEFELVGSARSLPVSTEVVLLRATQEALTNVGKHAAATRVTVTLSYREDATGVRISDDGNGFDPAAATNGFGLRGMCNRAEQAGGHVNVESAPGRGTVVHVVVP